MEKSSSPSPVGQRFTLGPVKLKIKLGTLIGYASVSLEQAKAISKSASRLKRFRNTPLPIRDPARVAISKNTLSWGVFDVADVRDAMKAGDVELFFTVLTLYGPDALRDCLQDPTISGIIWEWRKAADNGNRDARTLLARIGTALGRAAYRRPRRANPEPRLLHREAASKSKASSQLMRRFNNDVVDGRPPKQAYENTVRNYCDSSQMTGARKACALETFDTKVVAIHPGLTSIVDRKIWRTLLPRGG